MAWNYRRRIKIIPGVHLNLGKKGISTSIGVRGANLTLGERGTYLNTSIPGLGVYNRQKISDDSITSSKQDGIQHVDQADNIFSVDVQKITSQDMQGIKEAIVAAHEQRNLLGADLKKINLSLIFSKIKLIGSYFLLIGIFNKSIPSNIKNEILLKKNTIGQLIEHIRNCYVKLDIECDQEIKNKYDKVVEAFKNLATSNKIWKITGSYLQDTRINRSSASTLVKKTEVSFGIKSIDDIKSQFETLWMKNSNGTDMYFYPSFVVMFSTLKKFALIGLDEIALNHGEVRFVEAGSIPRDSNIIDETWAKVNKNGSPDKRFKGNYQIPIVKYGEINLSTKTGLNEEYQFSNYEYSESFSKVFTDYQKVIKSLKHTGEDLIEADNNDANIEELTLGDEDMEIATNLRNALIKKWTENNFLDIDLSERDSLFDDAARLIVMHQECSTLLIQQKLRLGPNRANRLIDQLEAAGIVDSSNDGKYEILIQNELVLDQILAELKERYGL